MNHGVLRRATVVRKGIAREFELPFEIREQGRKNFLRMMFGKKPLSPRRTPAWKDKASWRYMWLNFPFWQRLPLEIYRKIDSYLLEIVYECEECGKQYSNKNTECTC